MSPFAADSWQETIDQPIERVFGPAWVGYAGALPSGELEPGLEIRQLDFGDLQRTNEVLEVSSAQDRLNVASLPTAEIQLGGFLEDVLVAFAGYQVWGGSIAHIAVITRPEYRGRGFGRAVVRAIGRIALERSLVPQYRALMENTASRALASAEGFEMYGTMLVLR